MPRPEPSKTTLCSAVRRAHRGSRSKRGMTTPLAPAATKLLTVFSVPFAPQTPQTPLSVPPSLCHRAYSRDRLPAEKVAPVFFAKKEAKNLPVPPPKRTALFAVSRTRLQPAGRDGTKNRAYCRSKQRTGARGFQVHSRRGREHYRSAAQIQPYVIDLLPRLDDQAASQSPLFTPRFGRAGQSAYRRIPFPAKETPLLPRESTCSGLYLA
jgi:hypothetical protein